MHSNAEESSEDAFIESLAGTRIGGRYVLDRVLGAGGMGVVAAARYPELRQRVAIKFLRPEYSDQGPLAERFLREARVAARVRSNHFVRVFDVGALDTGVPYLVMELLSGRDLADEIAERGPLPVEESVDLLLQAATGIAEIHALGIVHRDLKPSNLFLSSGGGNRILKVLDFGISKDNREGAPALTATNNLLGTPHYMSPEQIRTPREVDARSDVFALGVILHEILTGKKPFGAGATSAGEVFAQILYFEPSPLTDIRPELPTGLAQIVATCLAKDRTDRIASVAALADALRPYAAPSSLHRIEAVGAALSHAREAASDPPPAEHLLPSHRVGSVAFARTTPAHGAGAAVTLDVAPRAAPAPASRGRALVLVSALVATVFGGTLLAARTRVGATVRQEADAAPVVSSLPAPPQLVAPVVPIVVTSAPSVSVSAPPRLAPPLPRPVRSIAVSAAPPPSAVPATGSILLDRK